MDQDLKELVERVVSLEKDLEWYRSLVPWALGTLGVLLAAFFGLTWERLRKWIDKKLQSTAIAIAERKAKEAEKAIEGRSAAIEEAAKEAERKLGGLNQLLGQIERGVVTHFRLVDCGEFKITFESSDYQADRVAFSKRFSAPPIVLLGEHAGGNWVFMKVDESTADYFKWAAKPIAGGKIKYSTVVRWIAIGSEA